MDWKTCINEGNSIKITSDKKRAEFLVKQAEKTLSIMSKIEIMEENASVFFANYYDAFLELLHALMYSEGYKVKNHYCLGYYLRDVKKDQDSFRVFNRARLLRNATIYYGEMFEKAALIESISEIKKIFDKLIKTIK